ncbi:hypothetical protein IFM89_016873 [Coptis chinensis]|uniref:Uncharacterized protein n=1 Tax=Coptis chinensis TaxID=261450 RepID=A0A835I3N2_9MAGN|nr:hypothetical protein IFM89_016873 [Coptis chinensis]
MAAQPQRKPIATRAQITLANQFSRSSPVVTPCGGGGGHAVAVVAGRVPYQDDWKKQILVRSDFTIFLGHWIYLEDFGQHNEALPAVLLEHRM